MARIVGSIYRNVAASCYANHSLLKLFPRV